MNKKLLKNRIKYTAIHTIFSLFLLGFALWLIFYIWYPKPLDVAIGVTSVYWILLGVDLILGPLLTFIVYKEHKTKLRFDICCILLLQISAYLFGLHTIMQARPVWKVFVVDDIELVSPIDIKKTKYYDLNENFTPSLFKQSQWVAAVYSDNPKIRQEQKEDEMFDGISLATRPETYQHLHKRSESVLRKLKPINQLIEFNEKDKVEYETNPYNNIYGWLPVKAPEVDMVALFDKNGHAIAIVNLRPWN